MSMLNRNQPLGLPPGSVRAILGILIVLPFVYLSLKSGVALTGDQVIGVVMAVIAFYFIDKAAAK